MPNYRVIVRDGGELVEGVERHPNMHAARQSAARTALGILLDTRTLDRPLAATATVHDEDGMSVDVVHVTVLVSRSVERR